MESINENTGVYFILAPNQNRIKIGRSVNVFKRYNDLKTGFMDEGTLILIILTSQEKELESNLHYQFKRDRIKGEWFFLSKQIRTFLSTAKIQYENAIYFNALEELKKQPMYSNVDIYTYIDSLRSVQNKVIIPVALFLFGIIISFYQFYYGVFGTTNLLNKTITIMYCVFFISIAPSAAYLTIRHGSIFLLKSYVLLVILTFVSEFVFIVFDLKKDLMSILRVLYLVFFIQLLKYIYSYSYFEKRRERIELGAVKKINNLKSNKNSNYSVEIIKYKESLNEREKRIDNIAYKIIFMVTLIYLILSVLFSLFFSGDFWVKIFINFVIIAGTLPMLLKLARNLDIVKSTIDVPLINKNPGFILAFSFFIVNYFYFEFNSKCLEALFYLNALYFIFLAIPVLWKEYLLDKIAIEKECIETYYTSNNNGVN